ncbi:hypothetical protein [Pustulibacterium marinum]|uniref:hypothetical protein n=1 Tax=Pustulibacterium marinum TaxID=1224947 RepID=UPI000B854308|nr:hypothetical protein [Pustulibacterium marinum]
MGKSEHSDLNYSAFRQFDSFEIYKDNGIKKAFEPIQGNFDIYFFISAFTGDSFDGTRKTFHDYLILKVNAKTEAIIDGFQYTLEWAEPPPISDLYRVTDKTRKLSDGINLNQLQMTHVEIAYLTEEEKVLKDHGVLKLKE